MFDIGWSEFAVIAVVALIAIGPKELPGVLRMVGQWVAKARKMAGEFQGQFNEAMREAEMADLKKTFDEVRDAATGLASNNIMTSLQKDVSDSLKIDQIDPPTLPKTPEPPHAETLNEAVTHVSGQEAVATEEPVAVHETVAEPVSVHEPVSAHEPVSTHEAVAAQEPLVIAPPVEPTTETASVTHDGAVQAEVLRDAKAS